MGEIILKRHYKYPEYSLVSLMKYGIALSQRLFDRDLISGIARECFRFLGWVENQNAGVLIKLFYYNGLNQNQLAALSTAFCYCWRR